MNNRGFRGLVVLLLSVSYIAGPAYAEDQVFQHGVVAADHSLAAEAGLEILKAGGNTVDAAVATSFTLSVTRPYSCGLGGGGFMVIWDAERKHSVAIDYRERAPGAAHRELYLQNEDADIPQSDLSSKGMLAVGVPGNVAGLTYALEHYGTMDLKTVMAPAIRLAQEGFPFDDYDRNIYQSALRRFESNSFYRKRFEVLYQKYLHDGNTPEVGSVHPSPQLPALELIAKEGRKAFYEGPISEAILKLSREQGGILTAEDFASMQPVVRQPLRGEFDGHEILAMPPPSSGGVALLQMLGTINAWERRFPDKKLTPWDGQNPESIHLLTEVMKHAYADRAEFLGDTDFVEVPIERMISAEYARTTAERISPERTGKPEDYGRFMLNDDGGTSHLSVIDSKGNAVACTETINLVFGSYMVEPTFGVVLNNEMDDFTARPGEPNKFGLRQSENNTIEPGKKPLSSMTPTIVLKDGKATHVVGAAGGPRIISASTLALLQMVRFNRTPLEAVTLPRLHHQWMPDELLLEPELFEQAKDALEAMGHKVVKNSSLAVSQAVSRSEEGLRGGADPRKGGKAAGY
ncbi:MAG: gamma-glutamyltransferase [Pirellulaceae bacterium]